MTETIGCLIFGALLIFMGLIGSSLKRLPLSAAMVYLGIGFLVGPAGTGFLSLKLPDDVTNLRIAAEIGLLISLFAIGLRLRVPPADPRWMLPLRLGVVAMIFTVASIAALGVLVLNLNLGVAVLLGAMIAPTDPVLAHDVGVRDAGDVEQVRFSLSGEGGINDGTAYPCAVLGLLLCGSGTTSALHWSMVGNIAWGITSGAGAGWLLGFVTARLVAFLRSRHGQALGLEGFFALGLIMLSYGVALAIHGYGFLAVFAAGVAMRRVEHRTSGQKTSKETVGVVNSEDVEATATDPDKAHAFVAESVMGFTIELEHIVEAVLILLIGALVSRYWADMLTWAGAAVVATLLFVIRPAATQLALIGSRASHHQRRLISWFGIRGVGSLYYLMLAIEQEPRAQLLQMVPWVLAIIAVSIVLHGISAAPLMRRYA
ncbi:cation:proton antiporter [Burkholderia multivorans]|uniref:cation:proton antiporter n=1 Tax=Burkholderia multivorans TaxID=87883 RepID=UPI0002781B08|nr:cation:proton antiporter [Burkholderia multivorans]EJO59682.1 transporter, CPA2 family [Burkholderia multivorans CF2]MBJ9658430.1 cation:proton antiporter [Burkholderia multivorans]MBR8048783.1 cation:proton antiporter [Burkholderia multivorans]MBR8122390.1 cation:proton antiporter [Burkholderia multivorans]MBU9444987.1 cation:proton antiporter [Burkholderia multivorans]